MIRTIIVDDEPKARRILETIIKSHFNHVEIIGTADDVTSAVKIINELKPDLVFLDIEMPGEAGFQLVNHFEEINFEIIFTTAYSEYALKAFEISAIDYLLKPIQIDHLERAIEKLGKHRKNNQVKEQLETLKDTISEPKKLSKIALPIAEGLMFTKPDEIIYLKAESSYTRIYLTYRPEILVSKTLKEFEKLLTYSNIFMRVHRSYIINLNHITNYVRADGGYILMDNNEQIHISKEKRDELLQFFKEN